MSARDDPYELVTVFDGPMPQAMAVHASLCAADLHAVLLDELLKVWDPGATGGRVFDAKVQVSAREMQAAADVLGIHLEPPPAPAPPDEALALARRIQWSALTLLLFPAILILTPRYLRLVRGQHPKPPHYVWTWVGIVFGWAMALFVLTLIFFGLFHVAAPF